MFDSFFVTLPSQPFRFLRGPSQGAQEPAYMINMIMDVKLFLNQSCHAWACPKLCGISSVLSAFQQQLFRLRSALNGEFRGRPAAGWAFRLFCPLLRQLAFQRRTDRRSTLNFFAISTGWNPFLNKTTACKRRCSNCFGLPYGRMAHLQPIA